MRNSFNEVDMRVRLSAMAVNYSDCQDFIDEVGWEEWMQELVDTPAGEGLTELECQQIDKILMDIWMEVH